MTLYTVTQPDPPPGQDFQFVVPGIYTYDVVGITATLTTPCLPGPVMADSSGFGNNGTYDPSATGDLTGCIPGLVAGDYATQIANTGAFVGTAPCGGGVTTQDVFAAGWVQQDRDRFTSKAIVEFDSATQICFQFIWDANQLTVLRRWGLAAGDFDLVAPPPFTLLGNTAHFLAVSYDHTTDIYQFYLDGVQTGPNVPGTGHPTGVPYITMFLGNGEPAGTIIYDEIMWDDNPAAPTDIANMYAAAATSFAAWTAAVLAFGPQAFYHLDDEVPGGGRQPSLIVTNTTHELEAIPTGFPAVSTPGPYNYAWQPGLRADSQSSDGTLTTVAIPELILPAGYTVGTRTLDIQPTDQWSQVTLWWDDAYQTINDPLNAYQFPGGIRLEYHQIGTPA